MRQRVFRALWWVCFAAVAFLLPYLMWFDEPIIEYPEQPFQVLSPTVKAGESVVFVVTRILHTKRQFELVLTRKLLNSQTHEKTDLLGSEVPVDPEAERRVDGNNPYWKEARPTIPRSTLTGNYRVCGTTTMPARLALFAHTKLFTRTISWCTQTFHVEAPEPLKEPTS